MDTHERGLPELLQETENSAEMGLFKARVEYFEGDFDNVFLQ